MKGGRHILFYVLVAAFCAFCNDLNGQGPISNWSFGDQAYLNFQNHQATAGSYGNYSLSGSSVYTDCAGRFTLHSNATEIKDENAAIITGGTLFSSNSPSECLFVPVPGNNDRVLLFHINKYNVDTFNLYCSTVDYTAGNLQVSSANNRLDSLIANKLSATMHSNNVDYWLVIYSHTQAAFLSYLVTASGISATPIVSIVPGTVPPLASEIEGLMKFSPSGDKLAVAYKGSDRLMVYHFDKQTGIVSTANPLLQLNIMQPVGVAFSVDEKFLYYSTSTYSRLYQFDYQNYSATGNYHQVLLDSLFSGEYGDLQLAPDGKLYAAVSVSTYLAAVEKPSLAYPDCKYIRNDLYLAGHSCFVGLPDFVQTFTDVTTNLTSDSVCLNDTVFVVPDHIGGFASSYTIDWGDGSTDQYVAATVPEKFSHLYLSSGTFSVGLIINYPCYTDTISLMVKVNPLPVINLGADTSLCEGLSLPVSVSSGYDTYEWSDGSTSPLNIIESGSTEVLTVTFNGCIFSDTLTVRKLPNPSVKIEMINPLCPDFNIDALLKVTTNDNYSWSTGDTSKVISVNIPGWINITSITDSGCVQKDSLLVEDTCPFLIFFPSAITPDGDGLNDYFIPYGDVPADYNLNIYNRWNQPIFSRSSTTNIWPTASTPEGIYSFVFTCRDDLGGMYKRRGVFTVVY